MPTGEHAGIPEFVPPAEPLGPIQRILRTPDQCFDSLADFPYAPHYFESKSHGSLRIHYLDEGPRDAQECVLLMHGEPTWCYLYRHMIPVFVDAGYRVIAPDLVGFGRSDKPAKREDYSYERQVDWMSELFVAIGLNNCTPFLQDWGGLIGLRVVARYPERFLRVAISNTGLPTGGKRVTEDFKFWASVVSQQIPDWGTVIQMGCTRELRDAETDAYDTPFPSEEFKVASRVFPRLVPQTDEHISVEENQGAWKRVFSRWTRPFLTLFGADDTVSKGGELVWIDTVPGARGQPHEVIADCGHFIQEDKGPEVARKVCAWMKATPAGCAVLARL